MSIGSLYILSIQTNKSMISPFRLSVVYWENLNYCYISSIDQYTCNPVRIGLMFFVNMLLFGGQSKTSSNIFIAYSPYFLFISGKNFISRAIFMLYDEVFLNEPMKVSKMEKQRILSMSSTTSLKTCTKLAIYAKNKNIITL